MKMISFGFLAITLLWITLITPVYAVELYSQSFTQDSSSLNAGVEASDLFASALASGDFNDDGYMDLAVGVPFEDHSDTLLTTGENKGIVQIIYGTPVGLSTSASQIWSQGSAGISGEPEDHDKFGLTLATGDFNGDGYSDLVIGVPFEDDRNWVGLPSKMDYGAVNVIYGGINGLSAAGQQAWSQDSSGISGEVEAGDEFGTALAVGDFNSDGCDDLAIGVPGEDIGNNEDAGCVNIIYGGANGLSATGQQAWSQDSSGIPGGPEDNDFFGISLAAGDFNGDGSADLAIGVPRENLPTADVGMIHILYGNTTTGISSSGNQLLTQEDFSTETSERLNRFGDILIAEDFNNDGYTDLAVGVPLKDDGEDINTGTVHIFYGTAVGFQTTGNQILYRDLSANGPEAGCQFGNTLSSGDFNGDGYPDLAVGAPFEDAGSTADAGAVYIFQGSSSGLSENDPQRLIQESLPCAISNSSSGDYFGKTLSAGDFNNDGVADLAMGIPYKDFLGITDSGTLTVLCSKPPMLGQDDFDKDGDIDGIDLLAWAQSVSAPDTLSALTDNFGILYAGSLLSITDDEKLALLEKYAPRVWLHSDELFEPSSVEWAFNDLERLLIDGNYWLRTKEDLDDPSDWLLDLFKGHLESAPVYAFWARKSTEVCGRYQIEGFFDLVYYFYYPYNRGKSVDTIGTTFGHHVGDWEHITVRLIARHNETTGWSLKPFQVYIGAHNFGGIYRWEDTRVEKWDTNHPVVYAARGSHGLWTSAGEHQYQSVLLDRLIDLCNQGTAWDTWTLIETFNYALPLKNIGHGIGGNTWPLWMSNNFSDPGNCGNPADPACGPIYRWGNIEWGSVAGYCRLCQGPTGPVSKAVWTTELK